MLVDTVSLCAGHVPCPRLVWNKLGFQCRNCTSLRLHGRAGQANGGSEENVSKRMQCLQAGVCFIDDWCAVPKKLERAESMYGFGIMSFGRFLHELADSNNSVY